MERPTRDEQYHLGNLLSKGGQSYIYPASGLTSVRPHAATNRGADTFSYDANGNMTGRTVGGASATLTYDAENQLTGISGGGVSAQYVYDGDGNRVKATIGVTTTLYIGDWAEWDYPPPPPPPKMPPSVMARTSSSSSTWSAAR